MPRLEELHVLAAHGIDTVRLFNLTTLTNLRVFRVYHAHRYALSALADNPAFAKLTHLLLFPHALEYSDQPYIQLPGIRALLRSRVLRGLTHLQLRCSDAGDDGCEEVVQSGALKRLRWLDLRHGCITDEGARVLAACPDLARLEHLDVGYNSLTEEGVAVLRAVLPQVRADR